MLGDKEFNIIERLKPTLLAKIRNPNNDLATNFKKIPIKLPKNLKESETDG